MNNAENARNLAEMLGRALAPKDTGIMLRIPEEEKQQLQRLAVSQGLNLSDFIRQALYYYVWATSEIELKVSSTNKSPEYIDLQNTAAYSIYLANYLISDDTFDANLMRTNKHRHSFHFGPLVFNYMTGNRQEAVLHSQEIVRVYSGGYIPPLPPAGIAIWTTLPGENRIWNNQIDRVSVYRIARKDSEDIIAGIPSRYLHGLRSLIERNQNMTKSVK